MLMIARDGHVGHFCSDFLNRTHKIIALFTTSLVQIIGKISNVKYDIVQVLLDVFAQKGQRLLILKA